MRLFFLFFILIFLGCQKKSEGEILKRGIKENPSNNVKVYFNEKDRIYSNYDHKISFKETYGWSIDYGVSKSSLIRTFQKDSGYTFAVLVTEIKDDLKQKVIDKIPLNNVHLFYNEIEFDKLMIKQLETVSNTQIYDFKSKKVFFKNSPSIRYSYKMNIKNFDLEYEEITINIQTNKNGKTYTFGITSPLFFYQLNPDRFNNYFNWINFLN